MKSKLKEQILKSGYKQSYLASELGISENTLSSYISGRRNPRVDKAQKLANLLNCRIEDIFFAKDKHNVYNHVNDKP